LFVIKIIIFLTKIGGKIGFFIKKFIDNAKLKALEKRIKDADPEKIKAYMSKANLYDPNKIEENLDQSGLTDYVHDLPSALNIEDLPVYKSNKIAKSAADASPFFIAFRKDYKYTVKDGSVDEITDLIYDTRNLIVTLNGLVDGYKKNIEGFKSDIKKLDTSDKEQIKNVKSFISLGKSCISNIQKITKLMINQYVTLTKIEIKLTKSEEPNPEDKYIDKDLDDFEEEFGDFDFDEEDEA